MNSAKLFSLFKPLALIIVSITMGILCVGGVFGWSVLHPWNSQWLHGGDSFVHYTAWIHFKNGQWSDKIGRVESFLYPVGTTLMQTDSIPSIAIPAKWLFQSFNNFQFFGLWLAFCYGSVFFWGYRILELLNVSVIARLCGSLMLALNPVLVIRSDHKSLCFQASVLIGLWGYLWQAKKRPKKTPLLFWLGWFAFILGVHPYLLVMFTGFMMATQWLYLRQFGWRFSYPRLSIWWVLIALVSAIWGWELGYFSVQDSKELGFGDFSSDLLTLFDSRNNSVVLPMLRSAWGQYEGYGYLGLGMILLMFHGLYRRKFYATTLKTPVHGTLDLLPLKIILGFSLIYNLSSPITFGGNPIISYDWFYQMLEPFPSTFRATGRFIYPFYYTFFIYLIWLNHKWFKEKSKFVFPIVLAIQLIDLSPLLTQSKIRDPAPGPIRSEYWNQLNGKYKQMSLVPPQMIRFYNQCVEDGFDHIVTPHLVLKAGEQGLRVNSGYTSRSGPAVAEMCDNFWQHLPSELQNNYIWVVHPNYLSRFKQLLADHNTLGKPTPDNCHLVDDFTVCTHR